MHEQAGTPALTGDEDAAPELEVQEAPDAVGGVFEAAFVAGEQIVQISEIDIGSQQAVAVVKLGDEGIGAGSMSHWRSGVGKPIFLR